MTYDFLHLGVLKLETGDIDGALSYLKKSIDYNEHFADHYYYLGMLYKKQNQVKEYRDNMQKAKEYYVKGYRRSDPYTHPMDQIYLTTIEKELR